jgi:phosphomannomutase
VDHLDGLSVDYPDWWFNARPSQTEPLLRINIGALRPDLLKEKQAIVLDQVRKLDDAAERA